MEHYTNIKWSTFLLSLNDKELSCLDNLKMAGLHWLVINEELQFGVVQNIEALEEQFSWAFNLKNFDLIIEDAFWRYKFAEPTCL